ncbi:DMT family transporter [Heyndrickxia acidicola]|uniref:DMT family transporter n=1 Tax=Heyndrickxia acidicola TaxID=209389 RepID=A0ABU6MH91_9BACI|nr:DMT family transporter [Heyndrickxia acidicola]MED1203799.1 DMT family transporter [Heyndrickxia acidicola]
MKLYSALIGLSLIWGFSFIFIKILTESAGVWGTVFLRCTAGSLLLLPFLLKKRKQIKRPLPWKHLVVVGLCNAGLPWGFISLSETQINTSTASVLNALTPIFSALIGFIFFSKHLGKKQWIGVILGFAGILVLMDFHIRSLLQEHFIGIGTMAVATLLYGFASQYTAKYLKETGVLVTTACSLIIGAITGLIGMALTGSFQLHLEENGLGIFLLSVIGLGCLGSGTAHLLYYYLMKQGSPEFATTVTYLIPVTAMIWAYCLMKEPISSHLIIGLLIIFAGIYFTSKSSQVKKVNNISS